MKLSLNWLKDYIDLKLSTEKLAERLVMAGWEVEAIETIGKDTVFELEITPNRPDCLNILGLAREIGAITTKKVKYPKIKEHKSSKTRIPISIENKKDCSRYIATLIKNTNIINSPDFLKERLTSLGLKSISNAVDITNFVLMETGQPLHVFDHDKIAGGKIIVRRAKTGEKIVTIDGVERSLDPSILVIADAQKPVAIAGIMGGKDTEVTSLTKNILLESAHFDMTLVRRASRKLGLRSDSSYRFERNVDYAGVLMGANRATDLLLDLTKGQMAARIDMTSSTKAKNKAITVSEAQIESLLGTKIPLTKAKSILASLNFKVTAKNKSLSVIAPGFRGDVKQTVDLIEEISRIIGFDNLPVSFPQIKAQNLIVDPRPATVKKKIRQTLMAAGLDEVVTLSMTNTKAMVKSGLGEYPSVRVFNPLSQDQELMRLSLLPSLLQVALTNINRGQKDVRIFEIGKRYEAKGERDTIGILLTGKRYQDWRLDKKSSIEFSDLKGTVERVFQSLKMNIVFKSEGNKVFDPGAKADLYLNGKFIGGMGKIDRSILNNWDIKNQDVYFAGIDLEEIVNLSIKTIRFESLAEFPSVTRDVSLAVKKEISYKDIQKICLQNSSDILKDIQFIEQYIGDKVAPDQKGLVFSLVYQSKSRTLREEEVNTAHQRITDALVEQLSATRR